MAYKKFVLPARYSTVGYRDQKGVEHVARGGDVVLMDEAHAADIGAELHVPPPAPPSKEEKKSTT